ncbi:MAG: FAD:protein FMN transferase [Actinomycetales bacterium]|nr:FAD:protein FMN transferase [Actinomycetales bacterium]
MRYGMATWKALGTYVQLVVADEERLESAKAAAAAVLHDLDHACSRFRPDSDLSRANRDAGTAVRVSPLLARALLAALDAAETSGGLIDPTLGRQLRSLGYDADIVTVRASRDGGSTGDSRSTGTSLPGTSDPPSHEAVPPHTRAAWREVEVDPEGMVRVPEGVDLDLGSIGKAFGADLIATTVPAMVGTDLLISLGGDVAVGVGDPSVHHPWQVAIGERPDGGTQQTIELRVGAVATSSTTHRRWIRGGEPRHHVVDPRTGRPATEVWRTVTVVAATCVAANTASTAGIVLGGDAPAWLEERGLAARLVRHDGALVHLPGWPVAPAPPRTTRPVGRHSPG